MKPFRWCVILVLGFSMLGCSQGGTYRLYLRYQPAREFLALQEKIGLNLAIAPFKDQRPEPSYVGLLVPLAGNYTYYKSDPSPLENAMKDSLARVLSTYGIKQVPATDWSGTPDSLAGLEADSIFMMEIKKFWIEGKAGILGTDIKASIALILHLGVKKEGKVYTRTIDLERKTKDTRLTPGLAEQTMNGMLTEIFDSYFSNPY